MSNKKTEYVTTSPNLSADIIDKEHRDKVKYGLKEAIDASIKNVSDPNKDVSALTNATNFVHSIIVDDKMPSEDLQKVLLKLAIYDAIRRGKGTTYEVHRLIQDNKVLEVAEKFAEQGDDVPKNLARFINRYPEQEIIAAHSVIALSLERII